MSTNLMTSTDLVSSLMTYIWSSFIPAYRARGFPYRHTLDVSEAIMSTGQAVKVTVGQVQSSALLSDGGTRQLNDTPPLAPTVTLNSDRYTAFGLTSLVEAFVTNQATIPALINGAMNGLLNDFEQDIVNEVVANVPAANSVGTYGVNLAEADFINAVNTLITNYMPQEEYFAMLAPTPGAFTKFIGISTVSFAQYRRNGGADFMEESPLVKPASSFDQEIFWNGGQWSNSQLVPNVSGSGSRIVSNVAWHPKAVAIAVRPMPIPTAGVGAVARNFIDSSTGVAVQMLQQWNPSQQGEEILMKILYGMSPAQSNWSVLLKSN